MSLIFVILPFYFFLNFFSVIVFILAIGGCFLPWYRQEINVSTINNSTTTNTSNNVYYQLVYIYNQVVCNGVVNFNCTFNYQNIFIGEIPDIEGISLWRFVDANSDSATQLVITRLLFLFCWITQFIIILSFPFSFVFQGSKSSIATTCAFICSGSGFVSFLLIPMALSFDYGQNCVNLEINDKYSPCNILLYSNTFTITGENSQQTISLEWGVSLGFYLNFFNFILLIFVFLFAVRLYPCEFSKMGSRSMSFFDEMDDSESVATSRSTTERDLSISNSSINSPGGGNYATFRATSNTTSDVDSFYSF